jgi:phosphate transport system protein
MPEQRQIFQRQLDDIDAKVIELIDLVAADLARATSALPDGNNDVVKVLAEHRLVIDIFCPEVEKLTRTAILLQAPVASDLRFLLCVLRILPELERSYHLVVQIASRASHIRSEDLSPAAGTYSNEWGTSHPTCGTGQRTPGISATIPPPPCWPTATTKWTTSTPA